MSKQIEISDSVFQKIINAMGEDDTAGTYVARAVHLMIAGQNTSIHSQGENRRFSGAHVPDLTFTNILNASINGNPIGKNNWATLTYELLQLAHEERVDWKSFNTLRIFEGQKEDSGYWYDSSLGISVQGQSANDSWRSTMEIASKISAQVNVEVRWKDKPKAAHPGENAFLVFP